MEIKAKEINTILDKNTNKIVFENNSIKFRSAKCLGKIIVQYSICKTGNKKLIKKIVAQNVSAKNDLYPLKIIKDFDLNPPLDGEWYWAFFLDKFSKINNPSMKINK